ncbi:hypothetical protein ACJRO7_023935 [Eucalyptus globulus]|uniref:Uncharacterized protein n=1 Tax=Eucalyptus globulus TaxID=34317 RepID=A0ABD3K7W1_EUCGL
MAVVATGTTAIRDKSRGKTNSRLKRSAMQHALILSLPSKGNKMIPSYLPPPFAFLSTIRNREKEEDRRLEREGRREPLSPALIIFSCRGYQIQATGIYRRTKGLEGGRVEIVGSRMDTWASRARDEGTRVDGEGRRGPPSSGVGPTAGYGGSAVGTRGRGAFTWVRKLGG